MPPILMTMAANFIMDLVKDPLQNLAKSHIEGALKNAPKELVDALDQGAADDEKHPHKKLLDAIF